MSRILKRPMFRIGGSANKEGIVSMAVPRGQYANSNYQDLISQYPQAKELISDAESKSALMSAFAGSGRSREDRLSDLLISGGLNLMSARPTGGIFSTAASAFKEPTSQYLKSSADEDSFQRQLKLAGVTAAMTSQENKEKYKKELEIANLKLEQGNKELWLKGSTASALGSSAESVWETLKKLREDRIPHFESPIPINTNTKKLDVAKLDKVPTNVRFFDTNGKFYERTEKGYKEIYGKSGSEIVKIVPEKKLGFFDEVKEKGAAYDPRSWNKQKFYDDLTKKNSTME